MELFWFIPTHGDGRYLATTRGRAPPPTLTSSRWCGPPTSSAMRARCCPPDDSVKTPGSVASRLIPYDAAQVPGRGAPRHRLADGRRAMAATFDRMSGGRLLINVVTGGDPAEAEGDGIFLSHDERYDVTDEFLEVWRG